MEFEIREYKRLCSDQSPCFSASLGHSPQTADVDSGCVSFQGSSVPLVTHRGTVLSQLRLGIQRGQPQVVTGSEPPASVPDLCIFYYPCAGEFSAFHLERRHLGCAVCDICSHSVDLTHKASVVRDLIDSHQSGKVGPRNCWARTYQNEIMEKCP